MFPSLTIMLKTGEIQGFPMMGDYVSYCRRVGSQKLSNGKKKDQLTLREKKKNFFSAGRSVLA